jgi:hypothetical protein
MTDLSWHDLHLMGLLDFTAEDLEACQEGHLTSAQHFKLRRLRLNNDSVQQITGPVEVFQTRYGGDLICAGVYIPISLQRYYAFIQGEVYTLYYVVSHKSIISENVLLAAEYRGIYRGSDYPNTQLRDFFHFSDEDLDANRLGSLSTVQLKQLEYRSLLFSVLLGVIPLALAVALIAMAHETFQNWLCMTYTIGYVGVILLTLYYVKASFRARQRNQVDSVIGQVTFNSVSDIVINEKKTFSLEAKKAWLFIPGEVYTIYYVPYQTFFFDHFDPVVSAEHHPSHRI